MKKKLLSLALTLALCLSLATPALAANTLDGNQLHSAGKGWNYGPSLTLTGIVGEKHNSELELSHCYDVTAGGSLVLDMPYPEGKNRAYSIMVSDAYVTPDFKTPSEDWPIPQDWSIPAESEGGVFDEKSGKTQYVYRFTESDMGRLNDYYDKAIYMQIYWEDSGNGQQTTDSGLVFFYVHVVPAESAAPANPGGFTDVAATSPYADGIVWAVKEGITKGITTATFGPGNTCTTSHILTFLYRAAGSPNKGSNERASVTAWAKGLGIDTSDLSAPCTRAAAVTYMWKAAGSPASKAASFSDVPASADYAKAVAWAVEKGVTKGTSTTAFSPDKTCTRGQIVTFLFRAHD